MNIDLKKEYQKYLHELIEDRGRPQLFATLSPGISLTEDAFRRAIESTYRKLNLFTCGHHYHTRREPAAELAEAPNGKSWITAVSVTEVGRRTIEYRHAHWLIWCQNRHVRRLRECFADAFAQGIARPEAIVDICIGDFDPKSCDAAISYLTKEVKTDAEHFDGFQVLAA